jgi:uncharacterized protein involved in exopolysaccharide biosynthesis
MKQPNDKSDSKAVTHSTRIYQHLLAVYPPRYRGEYGPAMTQLFRDLCRDAFRASGGRGLVGLWLRVFPDLVKTSALEHISTLKGRKTMMQKIDALLRPQLEPRRLFVAIFTTVFVLVVGTTTLVTFLLPESYSSTARIKVEPGMSGSHRDSGIPVGGQYDPYFFQTQFEVIKSKTILGKVVNDLQLNREWGKKYGGGPPLTPDQTVVILNARLDLRPVRGTSLMDIRVFSDQPSEAAKLANTIARVYQEQNAATDRASIVDKATPGLKPVRPNKVLNISLGITCGTLLALVAGGGIASIARFLRRRSETVAT